MYKGIEIANYIINKCIDLGRPVSNLKLQKILYYVQGEVIRNYGTGIFNDDIEAWTYGPVVPNVYYKYNRYSANDITDRQKDIQISEELKNIINPVIENKSSISAWNLVGATHMEEPWKESYREDRYEIISIEKMQLLFN